MKFYFNGENYNLVGYDVKKDGSFWRELNLSEKAERFYDETDPIEIIQLTNWDTGKTEYWANIMGNDVKGLTAEMVNQLLEECYDDYYDDTGSIVPGALKAGLQFEYIEKGQTL